MSIQFFFDIASPYTYLAATRVGALEQRTGVAVQWRPFLLGGVFKATGNQPPAALSQRAAWLLADLGRWAELYQVPFRFPSRFPVDSLLAMRALTAVEPDRLPAAALSLFRSYWTLDRDPCDPAVLAEAVGEQALARAGDPAVKSSLRATTEEAVALGAFGAPTFIVGDELFFGNDRLDFVERAARRLAPAPPTAATARDLVERVDAAWMAGRWAELDSLLTPDVVMVAPGFARRVEGRQALVDSYREFTTRCQVERFETTPIELTVHGTTAVVVTRWQMAWSDRGTPHEERGHDLFVLSWFAGRWQVAWRTLVSG